MVKSSGLSQGVMMRDNSGRIDSTELPSDFAKDAW